MEGALKTGWDAPVMGGTICRGRRKKGQPRCADWHGPPDGNPAGGQGVHGVAGELLLLRTRQVARLILVCGHEDIGQKPLQCVEVLLHLIAVPRLLLNPRLVHAVADHAGHHQGGFVVGEVGVAVVGLDVSV